MNRLAAEERKPTLADDLLIDAEDSPSATPAAARSHPLLLGAALMLVALNLRPMLASLGPILPEVIRDTGISAAGASILTTAPVLCLGLSGFLAPRLARRFGTERTIVLFLLIMAAGTAARGVFGFPGLLVGSIVAGIGVGIIGVLLPGLVKRDFPGRASLMTGIYTMALCAGASMAAGVTVPLQGLFGGSWPAALAFWAVPAVMAALVWLPLSGKGRREGPVTQVRRVTGLWRDPLAWQVTLYMGLQSSVAYMLFGWLAPLLRDRGLDPVMAGLVVSSSVIIQIPAALLAPLLATRRASQSFAAVFLMGCTIVGLLGIFHAPLETVWLWTVPLGIGQGGNFALALTLIVLRSADSHVAAYLSGMAQSVGYTLAAAGPLAVGLLHDWSGDWQAVGVLFIAICLVASVAGAAAGRDRHVGAVVTGPSSSS
ncbi:MFS transporter [Skermanella stibiiresistens SB22]|uniref:MFS transporter n=1 Tax=Skermanella stibiiresistens SB22 TaxID=1385369 RepID=W9H2T1_9PROT|nr:CynX/NimT family MFS transporter [Skermanella stibiiresistens]EWY39017.1 MFS transporter [Skermanella stibiiresistens SB22]